MLAQAAGGSVALCVVVQHLVGRQRPPAALAIGHYAGPAFPSGPAHDGHRVLRHARTIPSARRPPRIRAVLWLSAAAVTVLTGASQVYLGANWLTDLLGGWALGALWIAILHIAAILITRPGLWPVAARRPTATPWPVRIRHAGAGTVLGPRSEKDER
jgi:undecaprenyl-diphosphatase